MVLRIKNNHRGVPTQLSINFSRVDEMALLHLADMKLMVVSVADQIKGATGGQVWSDGVVMVHADSHAVHQEVGHFSVQ